MSVGVHCDEKCNRIHDARAVLICLDEAEKLLNSPGWDGIEDPDAGNAQLRRAAQLIVDLGVEEAERQAQVNIQKAMELCDACGQFRGSCVLPGFVLCVACWLGNREDVTIERCSKTQRPAYYLAVR